MPELSCTAPHFGCLNVLLPGLPQSGIRLVSVGRARTEPLSVRVPIRNELMKTFSQCQYSHMIFYYIAPGYEDAGAIGREYIFSELASSMPCPITEKLDYKRLNLTLWPH